VSVRRTVPVIGSVRKEGGRRITSSHVCVILAAAFNFVLRISEWNDMI